PYITSRLLSSSFFFHCYAAPRLLPSFPTRRSSDLPPPPPPNLPTPPRSLQQPATPEMPFAPTPPAPPAPPTPQPLQPLFPPPPPDRKSTRLNSSHLGISYAVFCLKKKNKNNK